MRKLTSCLIMAAAVSGWAQQHDNTEKNLSCDTSNRSRSEREHSCEMREYPLSGLSRITVDGRTNGGANIKGWSRGDILVRARVDAWANTTAEAQSIMSQVHVQSAGGVVRADAPDFGTNRGWSVSYEIFVPHRTDMSLTTHNGGLKIADIVANVEFDATNGGVMLTRLGGSVKGKTRNGGLKIDLTGTRWEGTQLDVSATNGGVVVDVPENYSARFEAGTVNGGIASDYPTITQGRDNRQVSLNLGSGGPLIRAYTTNGGVKIRKKS